jgi:hypothetical protein
MKNSMKLFGLVIAISVSSSPILTMSHQLKLQNRKLLPQLHSLMKKYSTDKGLRDLANTNANMQSTKPQNMLLPIKLNKQEQLQRWIDEMKFNMPMQIEAFQKSSLLEQWKFFNKKFYGSDQNVVRADIFSCFVGGLAFVTILICLAFLAIRFWNFLTSRSVPMKPIPAGILTLIVFGIGYYGLDCLGKRVFNKII